MAMLIYGQPMTSIYNFHIPVMIRLGPTLSLIFFIFLLFACRENKSGDVTIIWNNNQAIGISVPKSFFDESPADSVYQLFQVQLESQNPTAILGEHSFEDGKLLFKPLIPFSRGMSYEIIFRNKEIGKIKIPPDEAAKSPTLVAIYPTQDTLPENLLKLYLHFSDPMREGEALRHIALLNKLNDTIPNIFLDLQPELWNKERTTLTVWLDPGRIKRDLIPNQQMGNPLKKNEQYTLSISPEWKSAQGKSLGQIYNRTFIVSARDSISPDPDRWTLTLPTAETPQPLVINIDEPLDYFLLNETIHIVDEHENAVKGSLKISNEESKVEFSPDKPWPAGRYRLRVASYLEDLAGNNLNKVFDRDITTQQSGDKPNYVRHFVLNR
jgi:hypothetical protein